MRVVLHIGPHKTGTTSVQAYLVERFGSAAPTTPVWYPLPERCGPGHAALAQEMEAVASGPNPLTELLGTAADAGVTDLLLSSERFTRAYPNRLAPYAAALRGHDVVLLTTQTPFTSRVGSLWQQQVKGGMTATLDETFVQILDKEPFQSDFLERFADAVQPIEIAIVYVRRDDPSELLLTRVLDAIGLPAAPDDHGLAVRRNPRLGWIEVETLRRLNALLAAAAPQLERQEYLPLRKAMLAVFRSERWREHCPATEFPTPAAAIDAARAAAARFGEQVERLAADWPVRTFGEPDSVDPDLP